MKRWLSRNRWPWLLGWLAVAAGLLFGCPATAWAAGRIPNDSYFSQQWYLEKIRAPEAWVNSLGFEGVTVAVIDSGVDIDHPDLKDNIWRNLDEVAGNGLDDDGNGYVDDVWGWDFVSRDNDPRPDVSGSFSPVGVSHGTVNAGLIAARGDNGLGVVGVSWQSRIMPIRALDSDGNGDPLVVVRAVEYAVANGAKIINLSFTGRHQNELLAIALRRAYDAGVLVVAAAGNADESGLAPDLDGQPLYPVCLDHGASENFILGVAASDEDDRRTDFSAYGAGCVDLSAPGTRVISTQYYDPGQPQFNAPYGGYYNGTSVAAAEVSGLASLLLAVNPRLTPKQLTNLMTSTAVDINGKNPGFFGKLGRGRIDAAAAVQAALGTVRPVERPAGERSTVAPLSLSGGQPVLVAAAGSGHRAELRMFTEDGLYLGSVLAYPEGFQGGVNLAAGDFDGTGKHSIVTGAGPGGGPQVRVFSSVGTPIGGFFAYDPGFRGGVSVAAGDLDGDGRDELITGAGPGGGPHIRIFRPDSTPTGSFFAYDPGFRGGVSVAAGDLDGDGRDEIVVASGADSRQATTIKVFNANGRLLKEIYPFGTADRAGARVAIRESDAKGLGEIVVQSVGSRGPRMAVFDGQGNLVGQVIWNESEPSYQNDGQPQAVARELVLGALPGQSALISRFVVGQSVARQYLAFDRRYYGGLQAIMLR